MKTIAYIYIKGLVNKKRVNFFKPLLLLILISYSINTFAQNWSKDQIKKANTAKYIDILTHEEKNIILYLNLARLYPKQFCKIEVENFNGTEKYKDYLKNSKYKKSLIVELNNMTPVTSLNFDYEMYGFAKCFAKESGTSGSIGHFRKTCRIITVGHGECCSYGYNNGKNIVLQLLIDEGVPNLGHRKICLASWFSSVGISISTHKIWEHCAVLDFKYGNISKFK